MRRGCFSFLENKAFAPLTFDNFILVIIVISTICLAVENPLLRPDHPVWTILLITDIVLNILFTLEVILKSGVMGFVCHRGSYLRNLWNVLDIVIVFVGWFSIVVTLAKLESVCNAHTFFPPPLFSKNSNTHNLLTNIFFSFTLGSWAEKFAHAEDTSRPAPPAHDQAEPRHAACCERYVPVSP